MARGFSFRDLALQLDREQAVRLRAGDLHMIASWKRRSKLRPAMPR